MRRQYPFHLFEPRWQQHWDREQTFKAFNPGETIPAEHPFAQRHGADAMDTANVADGKAPSKFYILDMFPYPSGAGLHVGHPEGYTATDILARYRRAKGQHVLHPMGWDAFGLPAEQYAVKTGQHPRITTEANVANFTRQIKSLGFSYDWSREVNTTDPNYFKWTQWIFLQLYNSWFNPETNKAEPISTLTYPAHCDSEASKRAYRDSKRLAFVSEAPVNWCPELGTVLANEEVIDGKSEVGGFPVIRKPMRQWMLRITAYAERLLTDLDTIDWSDSLKEMQRNWIGRSEGAEVDFQIDGSSEKIRVFTTRPDTLFGATYMVLSPEHKLLNHIVPESWPDNVPNSWKQGVPAGNPSSEQDRNSAEPITNLFVCEVVDLNRMEVSAEVLAAISAGIARQHRVFPIGRTEDGVMMAIDDPSDLDRMEAVQVALGTSIEWRIATRSDIEQALQLHYPMSPWEAVNDYQKYAASKSDLERTELAKEKTGVFTGAYAINPVNGEKIPIWIADYVLASYGTGAIMAVPGHDERDFEFATKFELPIVQVVQPPDSDTDWRGFTDPGTAINSSNAEIALNGLPTTEAKKKITAWLDEKGLGKRTINYKLRDWLFSRQRYWGEPFPIIWKKDEAGNLYHESLPESALPVLPPTLEDYKPTADGQPPLARATDWLNLPDGSVRETNTMPQWAGSCWYYLRYLDAKRSESFCGTLAEGYWMGRTRNDGFLLPDQWRARLRQLYEFALGSSANEKRYVTFDLVRRKDAEAIVVATGLQVRGHRHFIDNFAIRHIMKQHGDPQTESQRGMVAITFEDLALLPEIVEHPDSIVAGGATAGGMETILYEKRVNGCICVVEEVRESKGLLAVKTMYKRKATASHAHEGLTQTPEALRRSDLNKPDVNPDVKPAPGVDLYVGGTEHAVLHLLYARFWHKVLFDLGHVSTAEPFFKLVNQGLILGEDGQKMSKSRGNVVNPDDVLKEFGADAFRLYEMFMGPLQDSKPWNTRGVEGVYRFLGRVWRMFIDEQSEKEFELAETTAEAGKHGTLLNILKLNSAIQDIEATPAQLKALHACIKKVTEDLDGMRFNTAISAMMVFVNEAMTWDAKPRSVLRDFLQLLAPFAPHIAEELWSRLHESRTTEHESAPSLTYAAWPTFDPALLVEDTLEIPVQVNGKLRDVIKVATDADKATLESTALASEKVKAFTDGKTIKKIIVVPKKMVNVVAV